MENEDIMVQDCESSFSDEKRTVPHTVNSQEARKF